uniref:Putative phosphonate-binding periplasmic protein n=1 Tax=Magnetococcus massalia (strain MO-1) TaxID=451514 RepID=A0A1S7LL03_MAGMO|nr:Putative phosphonate-binding periplasmic protein [Candidatus Magnetococcus massalia]
MALQFVRIKLSLCALLFLLSGVAAAASAATPSAATPLVLGVHPYLPATTLVKRFTPLVTYLSEALQRPVTLRIGSSYRDHIDAVGQKRVDIGFFGPAIYLVLVRDYGPQPLLGRLSFKGGKSSFQGVIFTRKNSPIQTLAALKGKRFAFGDANSTMSSQVPKALLRQAGVEENQLGFYKHMKNHHNVALGVLLGKYDAGGAKEEVFWEYQSRGLRALKWSPPFVSHAFVANRDLPSTLRQQLQKWLLTVHEHPRAVEILEGIKAETKRIIPVEESDFDSLRTLLSMP